MPRWLAILLPGLVFQSVVVGGGYATGRELVEFFLPAGPWGGVLGILVTMLVWSAVLMVSLELARSRQAYDYRSFFQGLLGRAWWSFELAYLCLLVLVLAVLGAASGEMAHSQLGWPDWLGSLALMLAISGVLGIGQRGLQRTLSLFAIALYLVFLVFVAWTTLRFGDRIVSAFAQPPGSGWGWAGLRYAGYNLAVVPAVLFCARHLSSRRDSLLAGALCGPLAMLPGLMFFVALSAFHADMASVALPSSYVLQQLDAGLFSPLFQLVVFATLVATGAGLIHAVNERIAVVLERRHKALSPLARRLIAIGLMVFAMFGATTIGLIDLIAKGYGWLTWAFIGIFVVPVLTLGVWQLGPGARVIEET